METSKSYKKRNFTPLILLTPSSFWLFLFFIIPMIIVFIYSFLTRNNAGGILWQFTIENYERIFQWTYLKIFLYSIWIALFCTLLCLIIGYPVAYFISTRKSSRVKNGLILLVIVPFWTNFLVRTYAWLIILRENGIINSILLQLGIVDEPIKLLFTKFAVIVGLVYGYLPFMILPLYASLEKVDKTLLDAAQDLGANRFEVFRRVLFPLTSPGILAGSILVFIPVLGAYITPDLLGGAKDMMIGNLIQNQFLKLRNWPFGAALSFVILAIVLILLYSYVKLGVEDDRATGYKGR